ncbi:MAG: hypothetical protein ACFFBZ_15595, partial [Promethearchaeota archaeon]
KGTAIMGMIDSKAAKNSDFHMGNFIKKETSFLKGKGGGKSDYGQGFVEKKYVNTDKIVKHFYKRLFKKE